MLEVKSSKLQAVILAAGKSTRTYPLTLTKPKPLLKILDKTILDHNLDQLRGIVDDVVIIVGYMKDAIISKLGKIYHGIKLTYVEQKEQNGTGGAVLLAKNYLHDRFIVMSGDDLFSRHDIIRCSEKKYSILAQEVKTPEKFGVLEVKGNKLINIEEKPQFPKSNLANTGLYVVDKKIFSYTIKKSPRGELEFTDYIKQLIKDETVSVETVKDYWLPIGYPWNYIEANVFMLKNLEKLHNGKPVIKGKIEQNVTVSGFVYVDEGTVIKANSYIEGPVYIGKECEIGPFSHLRPETIIMNKCRVGKMELCDVVVMDNAKSKHTSYAAHSVLGENVNIGAGLITADFRHDGKNHITLINGQKIDSGRRKLGAFIGDNVKTGIGTLIYPGRKLWPNTATMPGEIVKEDKTE